MLKYVLVLSFILLVLGGSYIWFFNPTSPEESVQKPVDKKTEEAKPAPITDVKKQPATTIPTPGMKVYRNDEFGFEFQYPEGWGTLQPLFGSGSSLFNMGVGPVDPKSFPITLNITPKEWIENALIKMRARGVSVKDVALKGHPALEIEDSDWLSRPAILTFVLVDDEYWIDITGTKMQEDEYRAILNSFKFLK